MSGVYRERQREGEKGREEGYIKRATERKAEEEGRSKREEEREGY